MTSNDKWDNFLKNGSVLAYLSYIADKKQKALEREKQNETSNARADNKGVRCWGKR